MNRNSLARSTVAIVALLLNVAPVFGRELSSSRGDHEEGQRNHHRERRDFMMGVCVGEELAGQGFKYTDLEPGSGNQAAQDALKQAESDCRSQGTESPLPAPSPSTAPSLPLASPSATGS